MDAKHRVVQLLGITGLLSGSLFGLLVLRVLILRHVADAWGAMDLIFAFAFAAYLLSVGIRAMRWARGQRVGGSMKVKWGRVLLGSLLIFTEAKNHFGRQDKICLLTLHILCIYSLPPVLLCYGYFFEWPTNGGLDQFPTCITVSIPTLEGGA